MADYFGLIDYPTVVPRVDSADQFVDYLDQADLIGPVDQVGYVGLVHRFDFDQPVA